jgi:TRAP-type C4-dicarboxylate transport system permease small subunit
MKSFIKFEKWLSGLGAILSSLFIIALILLILTEIFLRSFLDKSTMLADEYSGYFYLASVFLGLGYTFSQKAHIRINIITAKLSAKKQNLLDIYAGSVTLAVISFIFYRVILMTIDAYDFEILSEGVSETPIYLTQIPMIVGSFIFVVALLTFVAKRIKNDS